MSLTYASFVSDLANFIVVPSNDPNYTAALPNIIDDAEQRIYRELQLLFTIVRDASATFATGTRTFNLPTSNGTFFAVDSIYAITPVGTSNPDLGTRNFLTPVSRSFIDSLFPSSNGSGVPQYFAPTSQTDYIVGPWPDQAYQAEVVGTIRPAPLSASNTTTILSVYLPDLFLAAALVAASGYQQNFSAMGDNPQQSQAWEAHYQLLKASADMEEAMKNSPSRAGRQRRPPQ